MKNLSLLFIAFLLIQFSSFAQNKVDVADKYENIYRAELLGHKKILNKELADSNITFHSFYPMGPCHSGYILDKTPSSKDRFSYQLQLTSIIDS